MIINKDMLPTEDVIPITYMGGTGGNFLCHFIVSAKRDIQNIIELSEHGNAHHRCLKDMFGPPYGPSQSDKDKINFIFTELENKSVNFFIQKPFYTISHINDIDLINTYFKKSVRITYDLDDTEELATIFYGKWFIDHYENEGSINKLNQVIIPLEQKKIHFQRMYRKFNWFIKLENMPDVLFISWKEFFKGNIEELITKISTFTDINPDNFSRESLIHWRTKTQYCIDTFSETK